MKGSIGGSSCEQFGGLLESGMTKMYFIYVWTFQDMKNIFFKKYIILLVFLGFERVLRMDLKPKSSIAFVAWNYNSASSS